MTVALRDRIQAEIRAGKTLDQILAMKVTAQYEKDFPGGHERFVRMAFQELNRK